MQSVIAKASQGAQVAPVSSKPPRPVRRKKSNKAINNPAVVRAEALILVARSLPLLPLKKAELASLEPDKLVGYVMSYEVGHGVLSATFWHVKNNPELMWVETQYWRAGYSISRAVALSEARVYFSKLDKAGFKRSQAGKKAQTELIA